MTSVNIGNNTPLQIRVQYKISLWYKYAPKTNVTTDESKAEYTDSKLKQWSNLFHIQVLVFSFRVS